MQVVRKRDEWFSTAATLFTQQTRFQMKQNKQQNKQANKQQY